MPLLFLHLPVSAAYLLHFCIWLSPSVFLCLTFFLDLSFSFFLMQSDVYLFLRIRFGNFAYFCLNSTYTFSILCPFHLWTNLHFFPSVCLTFFYLYLSFYLLDLQTQIFQLSSSSYEDERDCPILWRELQRRFFDYFLLNLLSGFQTEPMDERTYTNCKVYAYKSFENIFYLQLK